MNVFKTLCLVALASSASIFGMQQESNSPQKTSDDKMVYSYERSEMQRVGAYWPNPLPEKSGYLKKGAYNLNQTFAPAPVVTYQVSHIYVNGVLTRVLTPVIVRK
jgi:hypothetical protein